MPIRESELRERLASDDDAVVEAALHEHFEPRPHPAPLTYRWCLRPEVELQLDRTPAPEDESVMDWLGQHLMGWANDAQRLLRARRFARQRENNPHWPVVVAEGDSWMAHPLVDDITDHLLSDDRLPYAVLGVGAAGDLLGTMEAERDHEKAVAEHGARALLLSGGGNDLLAAFDGFLRPWLPGSDPWRLITDGLDTCMHRLMKTMRVLLTEARASMPSVPIFVHGYDYLQAGEYGDSGYLSPFFNDAEIRDFGERTAVMRAIVDRYNEHLQGVVECIDDVEVVDLRGVVAEGEWADQIHPNGDGFSRVSEVFGQRLRQRLG